MPDSEPSRSPKHSPKRDWSLGGLPTAEFGLINQVVALSEAEQQLLTEWQVPPSWDAEAGREVEPPGRGHLLIKVGNRRGVPFRTRLTDREKAVTDTNVKWHQQSRNGGVDPTGESTERGTEHGTEHGTEGDGLGGGVGEVSP